MANSITLNRGFSVNIEHNTVTVPATFTTPNPFTPGADVNVDNSIELPLTLPFTADDIVRTVKTAFPTADSVEFRPLPVVAAEPA